MLTRRRLLATPVALVALSVWGHVSGGGAAPGAVATTLVALSGMVLTAALAVLPRRPSTPVLTAVLAAFQGSAHGVLHVVSGTGPISLAAAPGHPHPHLVAGTGPNHLHVHAATTVPAHGDHPVPVLLMIATHLLATLVLAWLLGPAVEQVRAVVRRPMPTLRWFLDTPIVFVPAAAAPARPFRRDLATSLVLRGPPRFVPA